MIDKKARKLTEVLMAPAMRREFLGRGGPRDGDDEANVIGAFCKMNEGNALKTRPKVSFFFLLSFSLSVWKVWWWGGERMCWLAGWLGLVLDWRIGGGGFAGLCGWRMKWVDCLLGFPGSWHRGGEGLGGGPGDGAGERRSDECWLRRWQEVVPEVSVS